MVKHEAMAIRASRLRLLGGGVAELDAREAMELPGPSERATDRERAHRALAALATLKRDEARALVLQAAGRTYAEIEAETGWSHTKVNRALTEGRAAFRTLVSALEAGDACARHAPLLPALARGRAPADAIVSLPAHLRACGACRARLAELRYSTSRASVHDNVACRLADDLPDRSALELLLASAGYGTVVSRASASSRTLRPFSRRYGRRRRPRPFIAPGCVMAQSCVVNTSARVPRRASGGLKAGGA